MTTYDLSTVAGRRATMDFYLEALMRPVAQGGKGLSFQTAYNSLATRPECAPLMRAMKAADATAQNAAASGQALPATGGGNPRASQACKHDLSTPEGRRRAMDEHMHKLMAPIAEGGRAMHFPDAWKEVASDPHGAAILQAMKDAGRAGEHA